MKTYSQADVHETAVIEPGVKLRRGVEVGPYSVIEGKVEIGAGTKIGSYSYIKGWTKIGENNEIGSGTSIGLPPQSKNYQGGETKLFLGDNNIVRDYVTIHRGTSAGSGETVIGNNNLFDAYSHIAYDCRLGDYITLSNHVNLANHVNVGDYSYISKLVGIHQDVRIGHSSMVETHSKLIKDLPPYIKVSGHPARVEGLNEQALQSQGISKTIQREIKKAYEFLYESELNMSQALTRIKKELQMYDEIKKLIDFIEDSERGVCT